MRSLAATAVALMLFLGMARNAPADPSAYQIFERARRVLQAQSYPDPLFYRTTVHVSEGSKDEQEHFNAEAFSRGDVRVEGISDEEQAAPHESSGVNFRLSFSIGWNTGAGGQTGAASEDVHRKEASPDYLGLPLISPSYSFGLTSEAAENPMQDSVDTAHLHTIATVTAVNQVYNVSLLGTETIGGLYTYHLRLQPTSNPNHHRLRDLWVDVYTYQVVQLKTQGNFTDSPMSNVPWLVTFQSVDGISYIRDETALQPLIFPHDRTFTAARISFDDIHVADNSSILLPTMDDQAALREPIHN
jgi:hypothetical protein